MRTRTVRRIHGVISMSPVSSRLACPGKSNSGRVDRMEEIDRRIGARSVARLLGEWRPPGRARAHRRARRPRAPAHPRRQAPAADPHARRARAGGRARGEPHDGRGGLRSAARRGHAAQQARRGQLDPARPAHAGRARHTVLPERYDAGHRPRARRARRADPGGARGHRRGRPRPGRAALRARLRPARPPGAARRDRRPVHRARPADPAGPGAGHLRGAARVRADPGGVGGGGRPGARRAPDLPQRA